MKTYTVTVFILAVALWPWAASAAAPDSTAVQRKGLIGKFISYFDEANKPKDYKKFDFSVIGGPHYSSDRGFGIGLVAAGLYRTDEADSLLQPSSVALTAAATTGNFYDIGIEGLNIFPADRFRLAYDINFQSFDTDFWGIGYARERSDANKSSYKYFKLEADLSFTAQVARRLFVGPRIEYAYVNGKHRENVWLWEGQPHRTAALGFGAILSYDTRDYVHNAYSGWYLNLTQMFFLRWYNRGNFSVSEITASHYEPVWKGGVVAALFHGRFTYGATPWALLSTFGGSDLMRGYYEGRYRDKCAMVLTVELRQHVWKRSGAVVWAGAGKIFPNFQELRFNHLLPNFGVGYRWEFKKRVNVRLDYGIGRHCSSFIFSINEAF